MNGSLIRNKINFINLVDSKLYLKVNIFIIVLIPGVFNMVPMDNIQNVKQQALMVKPVINQKSVMDLLQWEVDQSTMLDPYISHSVVKQSLLPLWCSRQLFSNLG